MKRAVSIAVLSLGISGLAHAQATRTWVSGTGDDVNPCSRTAPCKTFAGAISKTASPGLINCLDPGGYGAVTITKSITIDCTGTYGSVLASGTQGIVVNALTTDKVVLRAIDINGAGTTLGTNGVNVIQAANVTLSHVNVGNFSSNGLTATNSSNTINIFLLDDEFLDSFNGVNIANSGGVVKLQAERSTFHGFSHSAVVVNGVNDGAILTRCNLANYASNGFEVDQASAVTYLESNTIGPGANGINSVSGSNTRMARNSVTGNTSNGITGAGTTTCFGTNVIAGNLGNQNCAVSNPNNGMQ